MLLFLIGRVCMKRLFILVLIMICSQSIKAQGFLSPYQKSVLDYWYAQIGTNKINGAWLQAGTITSGKLATNLQVIINAVVTNVVWSESSSNSAQIIGNDLSLTFNTNYISFEDDPVYASRSNIIFYADKNNDALENAITNTSKLGLTEGDFDVINSTQLVFITSVYTNILIDDINNP